MELESKIETIEVETLCRWAEQLEGRITEIDERISALQADLEMRIAPLRHEWDRLHAAAVHVRELMSLYGTGSDANCVCQRSEVRTNSKELPEVAYQTLRDAGVEMHYRELATSIMRRGFPIRGADPATYLLAYIGKDARFVRVKRGTYALAEWKPRAAVRKKRASGRKRAVRRGAQNVGRGQ